MLTHPLQRLGARPLAITMVSLAVLLALLTAILLSTVPPSLRWQIGGLLGAESTTAATAVLSAWSPDVFRTFSFLLGFDFLYDIVHNNAVAVFAIWGARRVSTTSALILASATAWVMWLDSALNVFENLAFLHIIRFAEPSPLLPVASAVFSFRSATLALGFIIGLALHVIAFSGRRERG